MFIENWKWAQLRNITHPPWFRYRLRFAFRQKATGRLLTCKQMLYQAFFVWVKDMHMFI